MAGDCSVVFTPIEAASKPVFTTCTHIVILVKTGVQQSYLSLALGLVPKGPLKPGLRRDDVEDAGSTVVFPNPARDM